MDSTSGATGGDAKPRPSHGNFSRYYSIRRDPGLTPGAGQGQSRAGAGSSFSSRSSRISAGNSRQTLESLDPRVQALISWLNEHKDEGTIEIQDLLTPLSTSPSRILDVGCNSGKVSLDLARSHLTPAPKLIYGVDVDESLIRAARAGARRLFKEGQHKGHQDLGSSQLKGKKRRRLDWPVPVTHEQTQTHVEIRFATMDWAKVALGLNQGEDGAASISTSEGRDDPVRVLREDEEGWDLIMVLSVTKWIHIHNSDDGLLLFFSHLCRTLKTGGILMLEAQPWKSYEQARRVLDPDQRGRQRGLRVQPEMDFEFLLGGMLGLRGPVELGESSGFGFKRPLHLYVQPPLSDLSLEAIEARRYFSPPSPSPSSSPSSRPTSPSPSDPSTSPHTHIPTSQRHQIKAQARAQAQALLPWVPRNFKHKTKLT